MATKSAVRVDSTHQVVICLYHGYCVLPSNIKAHFKSEHAIQLNSQKRERVYATILASTVPLHQTLDEIIVPSEICPAVHGLELHKDALQCKHCRHIITGATAEENMKKHLRGTHEITQKGALSHKPTDMKQWWATHWEKILAQRFFPVQRRDSDQDNTARPSYTLFQVYLPPPQATGSSIDAPQTPARAAQATQPATPQETILAESSHTQTPEEVRRARFLKQARRSQEEKRRRNLTVPSVPERMTNPYLEHTKFRACIENMAWSDIHRYTQPVTKGTPRLYYLCEIVKSMVMVYQNTVTFTSRWARIRVMQEATDHTPLHPLTPYLENDLRHASTIVKIFTFFYHMFVDEYPTPPTFRVSRYQKGCWDAVQQDLVALDALPTVDVQHSRTKVDDLEKLCHRFWMSLLEQTEGKNDFQFPLVTVLAFIAVDPIKDQFREAYNFATDLSAIKKFARFAACQELWEHYSVNVESLSQSEYVEDEEGTTPDEASALIDEQMGSQALVQAHKAKEEHSRGNNDAFRAWIYQYLTVEYPTPMSWVITTSRYIGRFRYGESLDAFVRWTGKTVTVREKSTTFSEFSSMVWRLCERLEELLLELTFSNKLDDLPPIPMDRLQDHPGSDTVGYGTFSPGNGVFSDQSTFLFEQNEVILGQKKSTKFCLRDLSHPQQVHAYGEKVQEFLTVLFLCMYFTSGLPGRLTELLSLQVENTLDDGPRNLFCYAGYVAAVPRYHKGYNRDKSLKMIYRFPPAAVGNSLVWYLWLIRPFSDIITTSDEDRELPPLPLYYRSRSTLLWSTKEGTQWSDSVRYANLLRSTTLTHLGSEWGPALLRHLLIAFARKDSDQIVKELDMEEVNEIVSQAEDDAMEVQAGHTAATAKLVYAVEIDKVFRQHFTDPNAHLKQSKRWHDQLTFPHPEVVEPDSKPRQKLALQERILARKGQIHLRALLRANFPTRVFRGRQEEVLQKVIAFEPAVAYIAGTGSGKSLSFLLPAVSEDFGQQIVITPLVALRVDIRNRCESLYITTTLFGSPMFQEGAKIILASPSDIRNGHFQSMVKRRFASGLLERIVVDEFHYVFLPDHEYRPCLLQLRTLAALQVPLTLLSATIPIAHEAQIYRDLGVQGRVITVREKTNRPNLRYELVKHDGPANVSNMAAYVDSQRTLYQKLVVYVPYTKMAEELSAQLGGQHYHGQLDDEQRAHTQETFARCHAGILVATIAFVAGVDVPDIDGIMWFGAPDHPITFAQGSGRGGRNGELCVVQIVHGPMVKSHLTSALNTEAGQVMETIVQGEVCIRRTLDRYLDDNGKTSRIGCGPADELCSVCRATANARSHVFSSTPVKPIPRSSATVFTPVGDGISEEPPVQSSPPSISTPSRLPPHRPVLASPLWSPLGVQGVRASYQSPTTGRSGSPSKRHRHQVSLPSSQNSGRGLESAKAARIERSLERGRSSHNAQTMAAQLIFEQLRITGQYWSDHCVACFVAGEDFDHEKGTCTNFTKDLAQDFKRGRLDGKVGTPCCYYCIMPIPLCRRWRAEDGTLQNHPDRTVSCDFPHAILDTWACLWDRLPAARAIWTQRIQQETDGRLDGSTPSEFKAYFGQVIRLTADHPVNRITLDVNWITQTYFLGDGERWSVLHCSR